MKNQLVKQELINRMKEKLSFLYGEEKGEKVYKRLIKMLEDYARESQGLLDEKKNFLPDESDVVLITYGDQFKKEGEKPLKTLNKFLTTYLADTVSTVHILPFFPYSSDDGFAVIDYKKVNPEFGDWKDINDLNEHFQLMFDAVINHISAKSSWFEKYKSGEEEYQDYFIEVDPEVDLSMVTRPRAKPLLTPVETSRGQKHVWTTFSSDQIDLNFQKEEVLLKIIEVLLFYVKQGARIIRLDAIAYLWKKIGTTCIHLRETHTVVRLFRDIFEAVAPHVLILTETNVPHEENISYFGDGHNEAHMVYQFSLPPLVLHTLTTGNARKLNVWAASLKPFSEETTFFNFLASHDGIGVRPVEGILTAEELNDLIEKVKERGGYVSYKTESDGRETPYELNITYFDALAGTNEPVETKIDRFIVAHSILFTLQGVPGLYIHSLLGSQNFREGVKQTGEKRTINREKLKLEEVEKELAQNDSIRSRVFESLKRMIKIRKREKALAPQAKQKIIFLDDEVFALLRTSIDGRENILALHNVSGKEKRIKIDLDELFNSPHDRLIDLISENSLNLSGEIKDEQLHLKLQPYQVMWLKACNI